MNMMSHPLWCWALGPDFVRHGANRAGLPVSAYSSASELADYFHCRNVAYFPGGSVYTRDTFSPLAAYDQVTVELHHMNEDGRAQARELSRLSRQFPNVVGGIIDDFSSAVARGEAVRQESQQDIGCDTVTRDKQDEMLRNLRFLAADLKSVNPALQLQGVCYTMHFGLDLTPYLPYLDSIVLWVWNTPDLAHLDDHVAEAIRRYRKPLQLGLYLFDYGALDYHRLAELDWTATVKRLTLPMKALQLQCERARQYLRDGRIEAIHILGSYLKEQLETEQARWLAEFCRTI